jgi:Raf kinase inhibitor-like YbhB/YbcL family protein
MPEPDLGRQPAKKGTGLVLTSSAFADGATIPTRYTADGNNTSPPLAWNDPPDGTKSFALVCEDPDAPAGRFVHWLAWDIKADSRTLKPGVSHTGDASSGVHQGENGFGAIGYGGPSPPPGRPHRYVFRLYALDDRPVLEPCATRDELDRAILGHVLAESVLMGKYGR